MHEDIEKNNHIIYFPTSHGFGASPIHKDHPMLQPTEFKHEGKTLLANDVFRMVHDINGHHKGGKTDFSPEGEHQAYIQHKKMYSPLARKALFTETAAQANYFAFGPYGKHNLNNPGKAIFPQQKAGLLPEHIINREYHKFRGERLAALGVDFEGRDRRDKIREQISEGKIPIKKIVPLEGHTWCSQCDYNPENLQDLKNHLYEEHGVREASLRSDTNKSTNLINVSPMVLGTHDRFINKSRKIKSKLAALEELRPEDRHPDNPKLPRFEEAQRRFNGAKYHKEVDYDKGFTYFPHEQKSYDSNKKEEALEMQKKYGNGKDALHSIMRTDNPNEYLSAQVHKKHYDDIIKEKKIPVIGGATENGVKYTDVGTAEPLSDEEARKTLKKHNQRTSGKTHLDGKFEWFS